MTRKRKIAFVCINGFLIVVGLYFGFPTVRSHVSADKRSPEQVQALIDKVTDVEKLQAIVKADDACIRADRQLASILRDGLICASTGAVLIGLLNILLVSFGERQNEAGSNEPVERMAAGERRT